MGPAHAGSARSSGSPAAGLPDMGAVESRVAPGRASLARQPSRMVGQPQRRSRLVTQYVRHSPPHDHPSAADVCVEVASLLAVRAYERSCESVRQRGDLGAARIWDCRDALWLNPAGRHRSFRCGSGEFVPGGLHGVYGTGESKEYRRKSYYSYLTQFCMFRILISIARVHIGDRLHAGGVKSIRLLTGQKRQGEESS